MKTRVLDSSAVLAFIDSEIGGNVVFAKDSEHVVSTVNLAEVRSKLSDRGMDFNAVDLTLRMLKISPRAFTEEQSIASAKLRPVTKTKGLSLGDRACIALAQELNATAVTADRAWGTLEMGIDVELIR